MKNKIRNFFVFLISLYQKTLSPDQGVLKKIGLVRKPVCVFYPTCSQYSKEAIQKYGLGKGFLLTIKRISRCHPWQKNHLDPLK